MFRPDFRRKRWSLLRSLTALLGIFLVTLLLFEVERNTIFRLFQSKSSESSWILPKYRVDISLPQPSQIPAENGRNVRSIKISVPFSHVQGGCEFLYAATVEKYSRLPRQKFQSVIVSPRNLIRFAYDHKNLRCESKDLSILDGDSPESITVQFVDVILRNDYILEEPRPAGMLLRLSGGRVVEVSETQIKPAYPFLTSSQSKRVDQMSTDLTPKQVSLSFGPNENFNDVLMRELNKTLKDCRAGIKCPRIRLAVSAIKEIDILQVLDDLHDAGSDIDAIVNAGERAFYPGNYPEPYKFRFAPWFWNKGSRHLGPYKGILQMHTKFAVIGDSLAISSNLNLVSDTKYRSRGLTVTYRSNEVAQMFDAIFVTLRTAVSYPLRVDRRHNFVLLYNSERAKSYVASAQRPYTAIRTEEGEVSNAYGILLDLLDRTSNKLSLYMSPITNSCFRYGRNLCFFDQLRRKAKAGQLDLGLSGTFYVTQKNSSQTKPLWHSIDPADRLSWTPTFTKIFPLQREFPNLIGAYTGRDSTYTVHHERFALLDPDTLITGSANFVMPFSLNTIEILRIPAIYRAAKKEVVTFEEPYFVARGGAGLGRLAPMEKDCLFFFEKRVGGNLITAAPPRLKQFRREDLLKALKRQHFDWKVEELRLVMPSEESWTNNPATDLFSLQAVEAQILSPSSYFCVWHEAEQRSVVVRLPEY